MAAMKKIMQDQPDIVNMAIGEANFDPPAALVDAACRLLQDKVDRKSLYTPIRGLPQTRQAVARFLKRNFDADVDPEENILMACGGTEALNLAITVLVEAGRQGAPAGTGLGAHDVADGAPGRGHRILQARPGRRLVRRSGGHPGQDGLPPSRSS